MMRKVLLMLFMFTSVNAGVPAFAGEDYDRFKKAEVMARNGQPDFAFMQYRAIVNNYPDSEFISEALYASGEYYFQNREYEKSREFFERYIQTAPKDHEGMLFALMYRLWLSEYEQNHESYEFWTKEILAYRRQAYVFSDRKSYTYTSPLHQKLRADYEIETIQFLVEGQPFSQITF